ncbi:MAG: hypothetical protein GTN71_17535 [Anaerolineae bacterium]|nr:hypothetical protein [Anaerolineae bacterium]
MTPEEVEQTRQALQETKVPIKSKVGKLKERTPATMRCMRCGNQWDVTYDPAADEERMCAACRSNSVRVLVGEGQPSG